MVVVVTRYPISLALALTSTNVSSSVRDPCCRTAANNLSVRSARGPSAFRATISAILSIPNCSSLASSTSGISNLQCERKAMKRAVSSRRDPRSPCFGPFILGGGPSRRNDPKGRGAVGTWGWGVGDLPRSSRLLARFRRLSSIVGYQRN